MKKDSTLIQATFGQGSGNMEQILLAWVQI